MSLAKVYVNGEYVGERPYGYASFSFDITKYIQVGKQNQLAVRFENKTETSRWYSVAGIYRNVRIVKTNPVHVKQWGTNITTPTISAKSAVVNIKTQIVGVNFVSSVKLIGRFRWRKHQTTLCF